MFGGSVEIRVLSLYPVSSGSNLVSSLSSKCFVLLEVSLLRSQDVKDGWLSRGCWEESGLLASE